MPSNERLVERSLVSERLQVAGNTPIQPDRSFKRGPSAGPGIEVDGSEVLSQSGHLTGTRSIV
jgi:hypothetical protein